MTALMAWGNYSSISIHNLRMWFYANYLRKSLALKKKDKTDAT